MSKLHDERPITMSPVYKKDAERLEIESQLAEFFSGGGKVKASGVTKARIEPISYNGCAVSQKRNV